MNATYVRVSTAQQNLARQLEGKEGEVYWDKISGMVPFEDRPDAGRLLDDAKKGNIEEIQVHSIKRLGRDIRKAPGTGEEDIPFNDFRILDELPEAQLEVNTELVQNPGYND